MDLCVGFVIIVGAFALWAACGHALWLIAAAVFRSMSVPTGDDRTPIPAGPRRRCPRCQAGFSRLLPRCPACDLDADGATANDLLDLEATARVLASLAGRDALDRDTAERFTKAVEARQAELVAERPVPPLRPAPQAPPLPVRRPVAPPPPAEPPLVVEPAPPPPPPEPRRSLGQVLAEFMEARNILWGELVGGLLIVGCSVALVISLWRTLEQQIPLFPFLVLATLTAALFAAGRYTLGRWKLEATSRGLLAIATLLTPLDFVVLAGLTRGRPSGPVEWAVELAAVAGFVALVRRSAAVLTRAASAALPWRVAAAVVGASASALLVPRWLDPAAPVPWLFAVLSLIPAGLFLAAVGPPLVAGLRRDRVTAGEANALLVVLGLTAFAAAAALVFLALWADDPVQTVRWLAVPAVVLGLPLMAVGATVWAKLPLDGEPAGGLSPAVTLRFGTAVGVLGVAVAAVALALAWPRPAALGTVGLLSAAALVGVAWLARLPAAHAPAAACFAVAFLAVVHGIGLPADGAGVRLLRRIGDPAGAVPLVALAVLFAGVGELLARLSRPLDAMQHHGAAAVAAILALLAVLPDGDPAGRGLIVYAVAGVGGLVVNARWRVMELTGMAAFVLVGAAIYAVRLIAPDLSPARVVQLAMLGHAVIVAAASVPAYCRGVMAFAEPLLGVALAASFASLLTLPLAVRSDWLLPTAGHCLMLAALWLAAGVGRSRPDLFGWGQAAGAAAALFAVAHGLLDRPWVEGDIAGLRHPWSWQAFLLALGGVALLWAGVRRGTLRTPRLATMLEPDWPPVDRVLLRLVCGGQLALTWVTIWTAVLTEIVRPFDAIPLAPGMGWTLVAVLVAALWLTPAGRWPRATTLALLLVALTVPVLAAGAFVDDRAAASAIRWGLAAAFVVVAGCDRLTRTVAAPARAINVALAAVPVLLLTAWTAGRALAGQAVPGPAGSVFASLSASVSLLGPLVFVAVGLTVYAVATRAAGYLFAAGQVALAAVVAGAALAHVSRVGQAQAGVLTAAGWAFAWLLTRRWRHPVWLPLQATLGFAGGAVLLGFAAVQVMVGPPGSLSAFAAPLGWAGWLLATVAAAWTAARFWRPMMLHVAAVAGLGSGVLAACAVPTPDGWAAYHVVTLAAAAVGLLLAGAAWVGSAATALGPGVWPPERRTAAADTWQAWFPAVAARRWVELLGAAAVALAVAGAWGDPGRPYWSSVAVLAVAGLMAALAAWTRRPGYVYASGLLLNLVAYLVWQAGLVEEYGLQAWHAFGPGVTDRFLLLQALAFAVAAAAWSLLDRWLRPRDLRGEVVAYAHVAALAAVHLVAALALLAVASDLFRLGVRIDDALVWPAAGAVALVAVATWWDRDFDPAALLAGLGLVAVAFGLHQQHLEPFDLLRWAMLAAAGYVAVVAVVLRLVPASRSEYFPVALTVLANATVALSVWASTALPTTTDRLAGPAAVAMLAGAALVWRRVVPSAAAALAVVAAVELAWSPLAPNDTAAWLHRAARFVIVVATATAVFRQLARPLLTAAAVGLVAYFVAAFLGYDADARRTGLGLADVIALSVTLLAAMAVAVRTALKSPALTDRARLARVWAAELLFLLLLVHLRLSVPDLFPSFLGRHWPFVVMAWSFLGVGLGELFRRRGVSVLAGPLHQTGLFLPVLPLAAFLLKPLVNVGGLTARVPGLQPLARYLDRLSPQFGQHAAIWFLVALLLAALAVLRRATGWALAAVLAANAGLWVVYANVDGLGFAAHPQLWLAPVGVVALAAELLYRARLGDRRATAARYGGLLVVYVSSTADLFIAGLGNSVVLPALLAGLSVAGVLAGIALRVRGFVYLGAAFLGLVVFSQIWHAAVDRGNTWVWWASGVVLGVAVLGLFALFEKHRDDVLRALDDVRGWR